MESNIEIGFSDGLLISAVKRRGLQENSGCLRLRGVSKFGQMNISNVENTGAKHNNIN